MSLPRRGNPEFPSGSAELMGRLWNADVRGISDQLIRMAQKKDQADALLLTLQGGMGKSRFAIPAIEKRIGQASLSVFIAHFCDSREVRAEMDKERFIIRSRAGAVILIDESGYFDSFRQDLSSFRRFALETGFNASFWITPVMESNSAQAAMATKFGDRLREGGFEVASYDSPTVARGIPIRDARDYLMKNFKKKEDRVYYFTILDKISIITPRLLGLMINSANNFSRGSFTDNLRSSMKRFMVEEDYRKIEGVLRT